MTACALHLNLNLRLLLWFLIRNLSAGLKESLHLHTARLSTFFHKSFSSGLHLINKSRCCVRRQWHVEGSDTSISETSNRAGQTTSLKTLKSYGHETTKPSQYQIQNWIFCSVACCLLRWRQGKQRKEQGTFFESLNLYGLLRYQALWTRSDADTFVEGWQISCPSRCLIAWPLFTKWLWWWEGGGGEWEARTGTVHFTLTISICNEHDGNNHELNISASAECRHLYNMKFTSLQP